jgi:hypothetical protein
MDHPETIRLLGGTAAPTLASAKASFGRDRREFITFSAVAAIAGPLMALAQQIGKVTFGLLWGFRDSHSLFDHLCQECPIMRVDNSRERIAASGAEECVALETGAVDYRIIGPTERYGGMASRALDRLSAG